MSAVTSMVRAESREAMRAFEPTNIEEAYRLAKIFVSSRLLPRSVTTPEAAFTIIAAGRELGLTAMQALRSIHIIEGKPSLSSDLGLALVKRHPDCKYFRMVETSSERATYETLRSGEPEPTRLSFTIEEAKQAGLTGKDSWRKYPAAMLRARCIMALARAVYPDAMLGVYEHDELDTPRLPRRVPDVQIVDAPTDTPMPNPDETPVPALPVPDDDAQIDRATDFAERIATADKAAHMAIAHELKAAGFPDEIAKPLREQWARRKKELAAGGAVT